MNCVDDITIDEEFFERIENQEPDPEVRALLESVWMHVGQDMDKIKNVLAEIRLLPKVPRALVTSEDAIRELKDRIYHMRQAYDTLCIEANKYSGPVDFPREEIALWIDNVCKHIEKQIDAENVTYMRLQKMDRFAGILTRSLCKYLRWQNKENRNCTICLSPNIAWALNECGHIICSECSRNIDDLYFDNQKCQVCGEAITGFTRVNFNLY